jgi:hypothetical protein
MATTLNDVYAVGSGSVTLTVIIGNAQIGASRVKLDGKEIDRGQIEDLIVGNGPQIIGKTLSIKSAICDVSDKTNVLTVRYTLKGGKSDKNFDLEDSVAIEGDSLVFRATIGFQA